MIGSAYKKFAKEKGLIVSGGVAYGALGGYAVTLCEGGGWKRIDFAVTFPDPAGRVALTDLLNSSNLRQEYRVLNLIINAKVIQVTFHDTVGTMKRIRSFVDWFLPLLERYGATRADICAECGMPLSGGCWAQINGICYPLHEACARHLQAEVDADNVRRSEEDVGNYLTGTLGALAGGLIGSVVWALVLNAGYVASLVGLLISWLAEKGYNLCRGRQGRVKVLILILVTILAVALGTFGSDAIELFQLMDEGALPGFGIADIPMFILALLVDNGEYRAAVAYNLVMGLLFAGLGVFFLLRQTARDVSGSKFRYMK